MKTLNRDVAPIGDDIESVGESRVGVETGNEEESSEAEIPTVEMNPKNPTSREKQEHEDSGHAVYKSWCAACFEVRGVGHTNLPSSSIPKHHSVSVLSSLCLAHLHSW